MQRLADLSLLAVFGAALTLESGTDTMAEAVPEYTTKPAFTTTLHVPRGMNPGAHSWFGATDNCQDANGLQMSYGSDGLNPFLHWNFYEDGLYYRIENEGLRRMGCNGNAWLRANTKCHDKNARREANDHHESKWKIEPTNEGTYTLTSYWKDLNCKDKMLSTQATGDDFVFSYDAGDGRQYWAFDIPVKSKAKEITKIKGNWQLFASGSGAVMGQLTRSVENSQGKTMGNDSTHEIGVSLKVEVEVEAGLVKKTGSLELGYNYSTTESEETFSQLTNASESTCTASCRAIEGKRAYMYQWKKQAISATDTLSMSTCHYVCLYEQDAYPKCPPTDCKNQECTECIECKACE